ncbi:MAG TPA: SpoIIE family protein phosphatase [Acidobacteriaceae bacterium]|jgi:hypothetical protein|nr:SpoIIE family protein phosphatase [Acidobacteriaceae bacterium]
MRRIWFSLLLLPLLALHAAAQIAPASSPALPAQQITLGQSIIALNGPWKFHIGDNPQWADPNFDDSQWETVDLTPKTGSFDPTAGFSGYVPGWTAKGHPGYWGYAWYRIRVRVDARPGQKLALAGSANVDDAYQFFTNGVLLGSFGKFPGPGSSRGQSPVAYYTRPEMFLLPQVQSGDSTGPVTQVLAFRMWMDHTTPLTQVDTGGMHSAPLLGESGAVTARYQLAWLDLVRAYSFSGIMAILFFLLLLMACSLILLDRSDPVYVWLAWVFLLRAADAVIACLSVWTQVVDAVAATTVSNAILNPLLLGSWVMMWWVWFRLRRPAWMPKAIVALTLLDILYTVLRYALVMPHPVEVAFRFVGLGIRLLFMLGLVWSVVQGIRQQGREGWLALPAVVLVGITLFSNLLHIRGVWFPFGIQVGLNDITGLVLVATIFVLLLRRFLLSMRRQRETALDIQQAREVQQVLIPEELPRVPGLTIESEYRPAREVGGDFFQILPHPTDGSVLIVVGDVTGHGLQAGMLVALIVGAIRTAAQYEFDPLAVLNALNQRLCGRGQAHATCLALRIASDGAITLANAGHLPPYLNGKELPMEGALPLGMVTSAEFSLMHFQLEPGDRLMLMSDGIAEAKDENGQLFGFDRIREMLRQPITAAEVAASAQNFGQEDDILVLRVERDGANVAVAV